eukprot:jgi/Picre1/30831/NNA_006191.t1
MIDRRTRDKLNSTVTTVNCYNYTPLGIIFNYSLDTYDSGVSERIGESGNSAVVEFRCSDAVDSTVDAMRTSTRRAAGSRRPRDVQSSLSSNYDSVFVHRKNALYRRAAELSAITDCEISIIVLSPDGELSQFSTAPMKKILRAYSRLCSSPHEIHNMESIQKKLVSAGGEGVGLLMPQEDEGVQKKQKQKQKKKVAQKKNVKKVEDDLEDAGEMIEAILAMRGSTVKEEPGRDEIWVMVMKTRGLALILTRLWRREMRWTDLAQCRILRRRGRGSLGMGNQRMERGAYRGQDSVQKKHRLSKVDFSRDQQSVQTGMKRKRRMTIKVQLGSGLIPEGTLVLGHH